MTAPVEVELWATSVWAPTHLLKNTGIREKRANVLLQSVHATVEYKTFEIFQFYLYMYTTINNK